METAPTNFGRKKLLKRRKSEGWERRGKMCLTRVVSNHNICHKESAKLEEKLAVLAEKSKEMKLKERVRGK